MKNNLYLFAILLLAVISSCTSGTSTSIFDKQAGSIRMTIDRKGKVTVLEDVSTGTNYMSDNPSYLIQCMRYEKDTVWVSPTNVTLSPEGNVLLSFPNDIKITVAITEKENYFKMEIVDAEPLSEIEKISWGPYKTNMQGQAGKWLGLVRSDDFTMGLLGLEPNTDTHWHLAEAASYTEEGSSLQLYSFDHTRGVFREFGGKSVDLRKAEPIDVTVKNSAVALFGSQAGKDNELDMIEKIELAEGLPHPVYDGKWIKRSAEGKKFNLWSGYNEKTFPQHLQMAKELGARILCCYNLLQNWGHFDVDLKRYPGGINAIQEDSREAHEQNVATTLYTLTTFLKPLTEPEPYVSPIPDNRLQTWKASAVLHQPITATDTTVRLVYSPEVEATLNAASIKTLRIDNEMIIAKNIQVEGDNIIASGCSRGNFFTDATAHQGNTLVKLMYVAGYRNFFPGTIDLSNELSDNIANVLVKSETENFVLDGFESCLEAGYGNYTGNLYVRNIYDKCVENKKEVLVTGSNFTQYSWHINAYESWGEHDLAYGTRGSMLDYRLDRQMKLVSSLMPNKMGQYYPELASLEDVDWIMAVAAGWDSGVDFSIDINTFKDKNPQSKEIIETLNNWAQAREENAFTEQQKMELRQTDREYKLTKDENGKWKLVFQKYWQWDGAKTLPSSVMKATNVKGGTVRDCSIDWSWTHNPGAYEEIALSDDMIHTSGKEPSQWTIYIPEYTEPKDSWFPYTKRHYQYVLRLPKEAPCAIKDITINVNGEKTVLPVTLRPGEYISIPHLIPKICIYDENHQVIGEKKLRGHVPIVEKGSTVNVSLSYTSEKEDTYPSLIMNARFQNGYFFQED